MGCSHRAPTAGDVRLRRRQKPPLKPGPTRRLLKIPLNKQGEPGLSIPLMEVYGELWPEVSQPGSKSSLGEHLATVAGVTLRARWSVMCVLRLGCQFEGVQEQRGKAAR